MRPFLPITQTTDWARRVAEIVNGLMVGNPTPFVRLAAAPSDPVEGQSYYDTVLTKVRTWDGSSWQDHW
jgi:hypothetical protein